MPSSKRIAERAANYRQQAAEFQRKYTNWPDCPAAPGWLKQIQQATELAEICEENLAFRETLTAFTEKQANG